MRSDEVLLIKGRSDEEFAPGSASPGREYFYRFELRNDTDEPVVVTGFEANFVFRMHPNRQAGFPADHCLQFVETVDYAERQEYPQVIAPGASMTFADNMTYHYIRGPVSNECQGASFFFGPPTFGVLAESAAPIAPMFQDATCDASASLTIPEVEGAEYRIDGDAAEPGEHAVADPDLVAVTATAAEGYEFADDVVAAWEFTATEPECVTDGPDEEEPTDSDPLEEPTGEPSDPTPPVTSPTTPDGTVSVPVSGSTTAPQPVTTTSTPGLAVR